MDARSTAFAVTLTLTAAALLAPRPSCGAASEWQRNDQSSIRLVTPWAAAPPSGELRLGLHLRLAPGWHVYWKNSGDAGYPPVVTFLEPAELTGAELRWPAPRRFELPGDLVAFGYEDEVVYPLTARLEAAGRDRVRLRADVDYLVCEVDCIPYRYELTLEQPLAAGEPVPEPATAPLLDAWWERLPVPVERLPGISTAGAIERGAAGPVLAIRVEGVEADPARAAVFLETHEGFDTGRPAARAVPGGVELRVPLEPRQAGVEPGRTTFAWTVTGLTRDGRPLAVEARREVAPGAGAPGHGEHGDQGEHGGRPGLASSLLKAFLGGLLLALSPAALALLAGELGELRRSGDAKAARRGALTAAAGTLLGAQGVAALAAARPAGRPFEWGAQSQEPVVAALLAVLAVLLALNFWGIVGLPLRARGAAGPAGPAGPAAPWRHLLAGLLVPLLALVWPVPLLGTALGNVLAAGTGAALAGFAALGLGLAVPCLAVAAAPRLLRPAPAAGTGAGAALAGFAAAASLLWLFYALSGSVSAEGLAFVQVALLGMALCAWLRRAVRPRRGPLGAILALAGVACAAAALWLADRHRTVAPSSPSIATSTVSSRAGSAATSPAPARQP